MESPFGVGRDGRRGSPRRKRREVIGSLFRVHVRATFVDPDGRRLGPRLRVGRPTCTSPSPGGNSSSWRKVQRLESRSVADRSVPKVLCTEKCIMNESSIPVTGAVSGAPAPRVLPGSVTAAPRTTRFGESGHPRSFDVVGRLAEEFLRLDRTSAFETRDPTERRLSRPRGLAASWPRGLADVRRGGTPRPLADPRIGR